MFCALSGRSLSWNTPVYSRFTSRKHAKLHRLPFFSHSWASSSFKGAAPKELWEKVISRRSKELKSDPWSCPLVLEPCWKFGRTSSYIQFWLWPGLVVVSYRLQAVTERSRRGRWEKEETFSFFLSSPAQFFHALFRLLHVGSLMAFLSDRSQSFKTPPNLYC